MTTKQKIFLRELLRTGDKITAYRLAYPKAKESSIKTAVNRLLRDNPGIAQAVRDKDRELDVKAEQHVLEEKKRKHLAKYEVRELLANVVHGTELNEKIYRTRGGFERQMVKPSVSQKIAAANACIRLEGWGRPQLRTKQKQDKKDEEPKEPETIEIQIAGIPIDDYCALHGNTIRAYFDREDGNNSWWPVDGREERFVKRNERRQTRKDTERQQRMTPELQREEQEAIRTFENREVDETDYQPQNRVIDNLREEYVATKDKNKLKGLEAVQKMCGLRFLHHRHRYEAEREAGWEFHPLNNNLIRKAGNKNEASLKSSPIRQQTATNHARHVHQDRHVERCETSPEPMQPAQSITSIPLSPFQGGQGDVHSHRENPPVQASSQPVQASSRPVQASSPEPPDHLTLIKQGYKPLKDLMQEEYDYYIRNQGSTTWQQKKQLEHFIAHRNAPPELRRQIEQETGWFYHPETPMYAKRDPKRPLVRTNFPGPPRY